MRDLFVTELGYDPVETAQAPRDLLADEPMPTYDSQLNKYNTGDDGFDEDEKRLIGELFTPEELEEIKSQEPIGFLEALKGKGWGHMLPYVGTGQDIGEGLGELSLIDKAKEGDASAMASVKQMLKDDYTKQIRGTSIGGKIGNIIHYAPSFMGEMAVAAATFGSGAAPKATQLTAQTAVQVGKKAVAKKIVSKMGSGAIKSGAITAGMIHHVPKNYLDRKIAGSVQITDKGEALLQDMEEAPATTAIKALGDVWVEVASEMSGGVITKGISKVASPVTKAIGKSASPVMNKALSGVPAKVKDAVFRTVKKLKPDANISRMLSDKVYFNGIIGEIGEERWAGVLKTTLGLDEREISTTDKYLDALFPDKSQLLAEIGAFSMMGVSSHAATRAYRGLVAKGFTPDQAKATLENMSESEKEKLSGEIGLDSEILPTVNVPVDQIFLSKDIPNFKEGVNEQGVVVGEQLSGKYDTLGTAPIVLWERTDGRLEVITGRHRLDLAKRTGLAKIPSQIVKESEGFTLEDARLLDVAQNIRDEKGSVKDYARFFKEKNYTREQAEEDGFLSRIKGRQAISIATAAVDNVYSGFVNGKISEGKAAAIADGAPNNEAAQAAGLKAAKKMSPEELRAYVSLLAQQTPTQEADGDLFGFDDTAIKTAADIAKLVGKDKKMLQAKISAVRGALKNPDAAREMGLIFEVTPENIEKEIKKLEFQIAQLDNFFTNPDLMSHYRGLISGGIAADKAVFSALPAGAYNKKTKIEEVLLPYTPENIEKVEFASRIPAGMDAFAKQHNRYVNPFYKHEATPMQVFKSRWVDYLEPLRAFGDSIYKEARLFAGVGGKIAVTISDHTETLDGVKTGEGLLPIVKDFRKEFGVSQKVFEQDFGGYLIAKRYSDLIEREDVAVTEQQIQESLDTMEDLLHRYGDGLSRFEQYAERVYDYQKRVSYLLVESGLISERAYKNMLENNPHYVPFKRILDDNKIPVFEPEIKNAKGRGLLKAFPTLKKIKGSDMDIRNPFASIVNNTASILVNANKNHIVRKVANLRKIYPHLVKEKEIPTASYDKGLRKMLVEGAKKLGVKYERTSARLTFDGAFGVFLPFENKIREKIGVDAALAHEFGHALDHNAGLGHAILHSGKISEAKQEKVNKELVLLANERLGANLVEVNGRFVRLQKTPSSTKYAEYLYSEPEVIANLYDAYINAPELLKEYAPTAKELLDKYIENSPHQWLRDIHRTLEVGFEEMRGELDRAKNIVSYYRNGHRQYIEVHEDLYDALSGVQSVQLPIVVDLLTSYPAALLRWGATQANITFALVRNPLRDTYTAAMQTHVGFVPVWSTLKGAGHKILDSKTYKEWKMSGGSFDSFMQINENSKLNPYKELFGNWNKLKMLNPFWHIEKLGQLFEEGTRVGVYEAARKKGLNRKEAAYISRDSTIDFSKGGSVAKQVNQFIPFFNANIQGLVSMSEKFKRNPIKMSIKALTTLTIPSIALSYYYTELADDEDKKRYAEIPTWQKNLFWNMKAGDEWVTIPKPFAYGAVFATLPQAITEGITTEKDIKWAEQAKNIFDNFNFIGDISGTLPPSVKIMLELQANKSFYTGQDIIPTYLLDVDPAEQYTDKTSELVKEFSDLTGLSPLQVEHVVTSAGAGVVRDMLSVFDMATKNNAPAKEKGEIPVARGIIAREPIGYNSKSVQDFMDQFEELSQKYNTFKKIERENPERADAYAEKHEKDLDLYEELKASNREIREISREINSIARDEDISPKEKQKEIRELKKEMTSTAKEALEVFEDN